MTALCAMAQNEKNYTEQYAVTFAEVDTDDFPQPVTKVYTQQLIVTVNGMSSDIQDTDVTVIDNGDGSINFELKNFFLGAGEDRIAIGNIVVENLAVEDKGDGFKYFYRNEPMAIQPGDMEGVDMWMGPILGEMPIELSGRLNDENLFVTIDIDLADLGQTVHVQLCRAKVYTEPLVVAVNGESMAPQDADVTVFDNGDGTINFELKNFFLGAGEESMPVGNIVVENLNATGGEDGLKYIVYDGPITILPGSTEGVSEWYGPMLGEIPVLLQGKLNDKKLYVTINLNFMGQVLVQLGTDDFVVAVKGDANGDGEVNAADVQTVLIGIANNSDDPAYDINGDGEVSAADVQTVLIIIANQ